MKKRIYILCAAALLAACGAEEESSIDLSIPEGMGCVPIELSISDSVESNVTKANSYDENYSIPEELIPSEDKFKLMLYKKSDETNEYELYKEYDKVSDYSNAEVDKYDPEVTYTQYLPAGSYAAVASDGGDIDIESSTNVVYGDSTTFTVIERNVTATKFMVAELENSIIRLKVTDNFNNYFAGGASMTLSTANGSEIAVEFPFDDKAQDSILFVAPETRLFLAGTATKQDPGTGSAPSVTFSKKEVGSTVINKMNTVLVDVEEAGGATIKISLNDQIIDVPIVEIDLNEGDEQ